MRTSAVAHPVDVALRDGSTVRIRALEAADEDGLYTLLGRMSEESRWLRFLSAGVNLEMAARGAATREDGVRLVVTAGAPKQIVAHAESIRGPDDHAEVAFEAADAWHGRGIATILLAHLANSAERDGIRTFVAYVHPSDHRMVGVFRESGFAVEVSAAAGELVVELPASLDDAARRRFDDRSRAAAVAAVEHVLRPASVALIGPASEPASIAAAVARNATAAGYRPAGFADAGEPGHLRLAICRAGGTRLVGPNGLGIVNTHPQLRLNVTATDVEPTASSVALASQSSALGIAAMAEARRRGLGLSTCVSTGDKADLSGNDFLQSWEQDAATDVVLLYLEWFGNPRRFARIARRISSRKPIVAVKTGRAAAAPSPDATFTRTLLRAEAGAADYGAAIDVLAGNAQVDAIVAIFVPPLGTRAEDVAATLRAAAGRMREAGVPLLGVFPAQGESEPRALADVATQGAGVEMLAGVISDPDFGPVLACGAAGPAVALLGEVTVRLAPVGYAEAAAMVGQLRTSPLLDGYRGAVRMDRAALEDMLVRLSVLAATHAEVLEIDCDRVLVGPAGTTVVEARAHVSSPMVSRPFPALDR